MRQSTRWLIVLPSVIAVAAIGLGTWQVIDARDLRRAQHDNNLPPSVRRTITSWR